MKRMEGNRFFLSLALLTGALGLSSPATAQNIQVTSADPSSAPQGTVNLSVRIKGKGFKPGAEARFFVTGTSNPGGVTVHATTFVNPSELVANIDIDDAAVLGSFDIEVLAAGRTGKGIELFAVLAKGTGDPSIIPVDVTLRSQALGGSDDRIADDGRGAYVDGQDGVVAHFPGTGNFVVDPDENAAKKDPDPRNFVLSFNATDLVAVYQSCGGAPCFADGQQVFGQYEAGFLAVSSGGTDCDEIAIATSPRDMAPGICIQAHVGLNFHRPPASGLFLRCGTTPNDGLDLSGTEHIRLECTSGGSGCTNWSAEPFLGGSGETLVCRLFEYSTRGRIDPVKIADFNMPFAFVASLR